jgi:hypothetical protein
MSKPDVTPERVGELKVPFTPFYNSTLPIGTKCIICNDDEDRFIIKFPEKVGYSGSYRIKKTYVSEII